MMTSTRPNFAATDGSMRAIVVRSSGCPSDQPMPGPGFWDSQTHTHAHKHTVPDDFCYDSLLQCEWEICPGFWEVFSAANGAMTGIHVFFSYVVVTLLIECLVKNSRDPQVEQVEVVTDDPGILAEGEVELGMKD